MLALYSIKGGVGKTASAVSLATEAAASGCNNPTRHAPPTFGPGARGLSLTTATAS